MTNHAAQLAIIKYVTRQESRSSAGNCQADEQTGTSKSVVILVKGCLKDGDFKDRRTRIIPAVKSTKKLQTLKNIHFNLCILVSTLQRQLASSRWVEDGEKQFSLKSSGSSTGG